MQITIKAIPIPKHRPRFTRSGRAYSDQKKVSNATKLIIKTQYKGLPLKGPLRCQAIYYMPIPNSTPKVKLPNMHWQSLTPDIDNLEKFYYDCLNGIVWEDDKQVAWNENRKIYSDNPRTEITITELF